MELVLNPYVKNVTDIFLTPLLRENGSEKLQPQLNSWKFKPAKTPNTGDWKKLTSHNVEDILESKERATLPINGKLKLCEGVICLELLMKFIKPLLRENGCEKLQPKLNSWMFNPAKTPKTGDWEKLTSYNVEDILKSKEIATLPINGKLKLCEGVICLL